MTEVIPAIMPESLDDLREKVSLVAGFVTTVQLDIMDGRYVPERTWPYTEGGAEEFEVFRSESEGLPSWDKVNFEADLMVSDQEKALYDWVAIGAGRVIVHAEGIVDLEGLVERFRNRFPKEDTAGVGYVELGVALLIGTDAEILERVVNEIDFVQFMGIARIGYQGEPFDERVLSKITAWRDHHREATISVDGGITLESAERLVEAGVTRLVSGSYIFGGDDVEGRILDLESLS